MSASPVGAAPVIALLGVGKLGEALLSGLLRAGQPVDRLLGAERHPERAAEIAARYAGEGVTAVGGTPEQFKQTIRSDMERIKRIVKSSGITMQ